MDKLDKALGLLRQLELDRALRLFFEILEETPKDLELIRRIYVLAIKKPQSAEFKKICLHIFNLKSAMPEVHKMIVDSYIDFCQECGTNYLFSRDETFNLFEHLAQSYLISDTDKFRHLIKKRYPEDSETADYLKRDCELLIQQNKLIKARKELKYLIAYYAETDAGRWALLKIKNIIALIN